MPDYRIYINPQPAMSELAQREAVAAYKGEIYVESRRESRSDLIGSLRKSSIVVVPDLFILAKAEGRKDRRLADLLEAKDEIHSAGAYILEASSETRSNDRGQWSKMRERAKAMLGGAVKAGRVGKQPLEYTDDEMRTMREIADLKRYKNWASRVAAIKRKKIKPPGRTWFYTYVVSALTDE